MTKHTTPITVFVTEKTEAMRRCNLDKDSRALTSGLGTLAFHSLIAQHGAGEFKTLYVLLSLKGTFMPPAGGEVTFTEGAEP